jgi:hypothetical protein
LPRAEHRDPARNNRSNADRFFIHPLPHKPAQILPIHLLVGGFRQCPVEQSKTRRSRCCGDRRQIRADAKPTDRKSPRRASRPALSPGGESHEFSTAINSASGHSSNGRGFVDCNRTNRSSRRHDHRLRRASFTLLTCCAANRFADRIIERTARATREVR